MIGATRKKHLLLGVFLVFLTILAWRIPALGLVAKLLVDILVTGVSPMKTYIFLLYLGFTFVLLAVVKRDPGVGFRRGLLWLLSLLLAVGIGEQLWFTHRLGVSAHEVLNVYTDYEFAGTRLVHNHVTKALLGQWLTEVNYRFDAGVPFVAYYWRPVLVLHFLLFSAACTMLILSILEAAQESKVKLFLQVICGFVALIHCIDGGYFSPQCGLSLVVLLGLQKPRLGLWAAGLVLLTQLPVWQRSNIPLTEEVFRYGQFALFLCLGAFFVGSKSAWPRYVSLLALVVGVALGSTWRNEAIPGARATGTAWNQLLFAVQTLEKDQLVMVLKQGQLEDSALVEIRGQDRMGPYKQAEVRLKKNTTNYGLCRDLGLYLYRFPIDSTPPRRTVLKTEVYQSETGEFRTLKRAVPPGSLLNFGVCYLGEQRRITKELKVIPDRGL